jgi:hypothetical protein
MTVIGMSLNQRYHLEAELGQGGMGVLYRARDTVLDREVAVKVLSGPAPGTAEGPILSTEGRDRLLRDAQAVAQLNHPNVVSVYDAGEAELPGSGVTVPFIVMELVEGDSLHDCPPRNLDEILGIACQPGGVRHRRLRPGQDGAPERVRPPGDGAACQPAGSERQLQRLLRSGRPLPALPRGAGPAYRRLTGPLGRRDHQPRARAAPVACPAPGPPGACGTRTPRRPCPAAWPGAVVPRQSRRSARGFLAPAVNRASGTAGSPLRRPGTEPPLPAGHQPAPYPRRGPSPAPHPG